jgi:hypothetical protein
MKGDEIMSRILRSLLAIMIFSAMIFVGSHRKAFAACSGASCYNLDPYSQNCAASAQTATSREITLLGGGGKLYGDLRYSSACVSNWARGRRALIGPLRGRLSAGLVSPANIVDTTAYTNMVNGAIVQCARGEANLVSGGIHTNYACA